MSIISSKEWSSGEVITTGRMNGIRQDLINLDQRLTANEALASSIATATGTSTSSTGITASELTIADNLLSSSSSASYIEDNTTKYYQKVTALGDNTIATNNYQFVFGKYNDSTDTSNMIEVVGKGTADNARSNARTLDWNGNEQLAGRLTANSATITNSLSAASATINGDANISGTLRTSRIETAAISGGAINLVGNVTFGTYNGTTENYVGTTVFNTSDNIIHGNTTFDTSAVVLLPTVNSSLDIIADDNGRRAATLAYVDTIASNKVNSLAEKLTGYSATQQNYAISYDSTSNKYYVNVSSPDIFSQDAANIYDIYAQNLTIGRANTVNGETVITGGDLTARGNAIIGTPGNPYKSLVIYGVLGMSSNTIQEAVYLTTDKLSQLISIPSPPANASDGDTYTLQLTVNIDSSGSEPVTSYNYEWISTSQGE